MDSGALLRVWASKMLGNMRILLGRVSRTIGLATALGAACAAAQTHKVAKPEQVVRAVGVYEWTGDLAKPTASRLIPVTVFINGQLEDAGVYLARPVPFALQSGNLYELQQAGLPKGGLELSFAKHLQAIDTATGATQFDDGWFGYGNFKALPPPKKAPVLVAAKNLSQIKSSKDDDGKPHFANKTGTDSGTATGANAGGTGASGSGSGASSGSGGTDSDSSAGSGSGRTSAGDPDRPTMKRRSGSGSDSGSTGVTDAGAPADDPDRPHLSKKTGSNSGSSDSDGGDSSGTAASGSGTGSGSGQSGSGGSNSGGTSGGSTTTASGGSADDPDRPTLKRRTPEEMKKQGQKEASASVRAVGSLNDDPDRPTLHYGKPASSMTEADLPRMKGLPADLQQMVAVSDAVNRDPHDFSRPWEDDAERAAVLTKMQALARAKLAEYVAGASNSSTGPAASPAEKTSSVATRPAATTAAAKRKAAAAPAPAPIELQEESLNGYTLSYGGAATYVYTAHTAGTGATLDYVTVVAQADPLGELKPAIQSATDAAHLDRTPRMRLVDAVDVEASNRASLLFELRGEKSRRFGVYRVIGARADETFSTGTTE